VTFVITTIQLSFDYFQEMNSLEKNVAMVDKTYTKSIAASLWDMQYSQLQIQVEGILNIAGIQKVEVLDDRKVIVKTGSIENIKTVKHTFDLIKYDNNKNPIKLGKLVVYGNVDQVLGKIYEKIFLIFISQFVKTLLVSFLIYLSIQHLITRHIIHISNYLKQVRVGSLNKELSLDREEISKKSEEGDEFDNLVFSINQMQGEINQSYHELSLLNKDLEEKVDAKTKLILDQRSMLEYTSKMSTLGEMAGGVAHEINNPITIISSLNRIIRKSVEKGSTDPKVLFKCCDDIDNTISRISKIITGLRVICRDGTNEDFKPEKISDILNDSLSVCREKFKSRGIELKINLNHDVYQTEVNGGRIQLSQVFLNLLGNSFDAIENLPEKWIQIESTIENEKLVIRFMDSGAGIPKELQEKIFNPFFTTKEVGKGTGLGLSLSSSIIKQHQGEFAIDNNSRNTCFVITLPVSGRETCLKQAI
jgi:C4-dicarboxylate-specific signal transduction histidine kinase